MQMNAPEPVLAVFVKTPGLSPIKTRLAEGLGRECADEFYRLSLAAVEATIATVTELIKSRPFWAIAENAGLTDPRWQCFPRIHQGTGGLGDRLGHVFSQLLCQHRVVIAIGADSPQLTPEIVRQAIHYLRNDRELFSHVVGRCHDGGFYLVGTNHPLSPETWHDVPYSTCTAADRLVATLALQGTIHELPRLSDVDQVADLILVKDELNATPKLSQEQRAVLTWVNAILESQNSRDSGRR